MINIAKGTADPRTEFQFLMLIFMKDYMNGTTSNAQMMSLNEADRLKLSIIVTLSMMEAIFATMHKKNTIVIKIKEVANCFNRRFV